MAFQRIPAKCLARANILSLGGKKKKENANTDCIALMTKSSTLFIKSAISQTQTL